MSKTVFITGATSGIGKATAYALAEEGYNLILNGRRQEKLHALQEEISKQYQVKVEVLCFDVSDKASVIKGLKKAALFSDKIDILINNAGLALELLPIDEGFIDDWEVMINTNVKGLLYVTKYTLPLMLNSPNPHIINIGSIAGKETYPKGNIYCATKHAVESLSKAMRMDLLKHNIKVSQVCPGATETEFSEVRFKNDKEKAKNVYNGFNPLKGEDIAHIIRFIIKLPAHVNVNDILIMPTQQASATLFNREV